MALNYQQLGDRPQDLQQLQQAQARRSPRMAAALLQQRRSAAMGQPTGTPTMGMNNFDAGAGFEWNPQLQFDPGREQQIQQQRLAHYQLQQHFLQQQQMQQLQKQQMALQQQQAAAAVAQQQQQQQQQMQFNNMQRPSPIMGHYPARPSTSDGLGQFNDPMNGMGTVNNMSMNNINASEALNLQLNGSQHASPAHPPRAIPTPQPISTPQPMPTPPQGVSTPHPRPSSQPHPHMHPYAAQLQSAQMAQVAQQQHSQAQQQRIRPPMGNMPGMSNPESMAHLARVPSHTAAAAAAAAAAPRAHAGTLRLLQYIEHFRRHINVSHGGNNQQKSLGEQLSATQWHSFVQEFFMPSAMLRLNFRKLDGGNFDPNQQDMRQIRHFDLPFTTLPRYHAAWSQSEVAGITMSTPGAHESVYHTSGPTAQGLRGPNGEMLPSSMTTIATHLVQAPRAMILYTFSNGTAIRMVGHLRAALTASLPPQNTGGQQALKFETLEFDVESCVESIDRSAIQYRNGEDIPKLPECVVNEYGLPVSVMKCLEIVESVVQMQDVMNYSLRNNCGPVEALKEINKIKDTSLKKRKLEQGFDSPI
ncbi:hypothetical protein E3Q22_03889 [Wallemia mellicola]|uniref:Uncharacterized protein n=2 Tax=Wallemia mellicola TaxID=1708541 RepID=A0A4T0M257_9BASI|nr:hypothetical protein WALSEDRAFT_60885 [Wallemia mellicola CBS 633.66]TIB75654.1 hypothetical protein E3Q22_03889 [Wallemia mellicola]EIM20605.1 hypothetical protein WALSEDRAFT_60885 [Wallemia mellicola CBS 633.66]TIB76619.1 hypothetical protein E3Q23_01774 [Wallemia mellicola]TIB85197.1 hypothetical protein E3Q21_02094 [Wallemia mellicola]TIB86608.1 hypothetical protein E3Q19_03858 [Wallemia mellicola]|eukprot:XP_006959394.1 hypothetical protein WALSEDRAFT_60885 [Wallemia mellicola CBS 633.66]